MADGTNQLPPSIQGDGKKFISLLKNYLKDIQDQITDQLNEVNKISNVITDNPDTIEEQVHSITVEEKAVNGSIDLLVKWNSDDIKKYAGAVLDVKVGDFHTTLAGFNGIEFTKHYETTKTNKYTIEGVKPGSNYLIRVRGKDIYNALSRESKAPAVMHYVEPNKYVPRPPYEGTVVFDKRGAYWSWKQYEQNEYQWTELRVDDHVGELHNRLEITTDLNSTALPPARVGTGYLYNKGVGNSYSAPLKIPYAKGVPRPPKNLVIKHVADGLYITFDKIPDDCSGATIYINNEPHKVDINEYTFICSTGTYTISVTYNDVFGEGEKSETKTINVEEIIDPELYKNESLSYKRIADARRELETTRKAIDGNLNNFRDRFIKQVTDLTASTKSQLTQLGNAVDVKIQNLDNKVTSRFTVTDKTIDSKVADAKNALNSQITQLSNNINLQVSNTNKKIDGLNGKELISRINLTPGTVSIDGKYIHITGKTVIDGNVIVAKHIGDKAIVATKIAEGAITTDKIAANAINSSKIAANSITGDKLSANSIESKHIATNSLDGNRIKGDSITADKLKANSITGDKLVANAITGDKIKAGSIGVDKLQAGVINLKDMKSSIQGGSVRIDGRGMYVGQGNGSYTKFDESGLVWYDSKGQAYGAVRRMIKGQANHGDRININWDTTPYVMVTPPVIPVVGHEPGDCIVGNIVCRAIDISSSGFTIQAYTEQSRKNAMRLSSQYGWTGKYKTTNIIVWSPISTNVVFTCKDGVNVWVNSKKIREGGISDKVPRDSAGTVSGFTQKEYLRSEERTVRWGKDSREDYTVKLYRYKYDFKNAPMIDFPIQLNAGFNFIEGFTGDDYAFDFGWYESIGWIKNAPDFLKFYKPFDFPVNFIAMDFSQENYYSIKKQGFSTRTFTGRGTYKFKPKGSRFKVYLIGASCFPWNNRPESCETKISGGGINYRSRDRKGQINGINGNAAYRQRVTAGHESMKYNEQNPAAFWAGSFGLGSPHNWNPKEFYGPRFGSIGFLKGVPSDSLMASSFVPRRELNGKPPIFQMNGNNINTGIFSKWDDGQFGFGLDVFGCAVPSRLHTDGYWNPGGYARASTLEYDLGMGISNPAVYDVVVPNNNTEYTITVGACPDAWVGKEIRINGSDTNNIVKILNTTPFDGGCIILEET